MEKKLSTIHENKVVEKPKETPAPAPEPKKVEQPKPVRPPTPTPTKIRSSILPGGMTLENLRML
jgi:hypothetical protein